MNWPERVWIYSPVRVFFLRREIRRWLKLIGQVRFGDALEIGCGLGKGAQRLIEDMGFERVIAFDLEERLVRWASRTLPGRFNDTVAFYVGDAQDLPFADASFDAVVNFGIIHHVLDWRRSIREISRVTKPGGYFLFEEIYPPLYANFFMKRLVKHPTEDRFYAREFLQCLTENGLHLLEGVQTSSKYGIVGAARKLS